MDENPEIRNIYIEINMNLVLDLLKYGIICLNMIRRLNHTF